MSITKETTAVAETVAHVALAIATIVRVIKEQPTFNADLYDTRIQQLLDQPDQEVPEIIRKVLEATVDAAPTESKAL